MASDGRKKNGGLNRINDVVSAKNQKKRNLNKYEEAQLRLLMKPCKARLLLSEGAKGSATERGNF